MTGFVLEAGFSPRGSQPEAIDRLARRNIGEGPAEAPRFAVVYMDLDGFKEINDAYGHDAGDRVLRTVARTLDGSLRSTDFVARLGGDEFAILLPETGVEAAAGVMGKARERMEGIRGPGGSSVNASIGVFTCEKPPDSSDRLLTMADALMYSAKKSGKNRILQEVLS